MNKTRLEAFSDGVIAILITILVLELKVPHGTDLAALQPLAPVFLTYVLSFVMLGIYWNNHHHLLHAADGISGGVLWANLHLLFWLSLIPFMTGWMGENHFAALPTAVYGMVLLAAAIAYTILVRAMIAHEGSRFAARDGRWPGRQGLHLSRHLHHGDPVDAGASRDRAGALRGGRADLARPRSADREETRGWWTRGSGSGSGRTSPSPQPRAPSP